MHSANLTTALKTTLFCFLNLFIFQVSQAQENSPYSRYGMGDLVPNHNISSRAMGGVAAGVSDLRSLNFTNPAATGRLFYTVYDLGGEIDIRTLKSNISPDTYTSINTLISYLQVSFPITPAKMKAKNNSMGINFGLRPLTRINYKIDENKRLDNIDSVMTIYEGSGGINQANVGFGVKINRMSFGFNTGYSFGNKDYSTKIGFINDSVIYYSSNTETLTRFGGIFLNLGFQYEDTTRSGSRYSFGAYSNLAQTLKAKRDDLAATFIYDGNGGVIYIDTVNAKNNQAGNIKLPTTIGVGFTYSDSAGHWLLGADYEMTNWGSYRYYGQQDNTQNSWRFKVGAQYYPASSNTRANNYWSFVTYRGGLYYGNDYIKLNNKNRPEYGLTVGAGFPLTSFQRLRFGEYVILNTGVELGARGNKQSASVRENIARISIGISMNARWFQKPKYD